MSFPQQTFTLDDFKLRSESIFAIPLPTFLKCILDYLEFLILSDLQIQSMHKRVPKNYKKTLPQLLVLSFKAMKKRQRLFYYILITDFVLQLIHGNTQFPFKISNNCFCKVYTNGKNCYSWKQKSLSYDSITHFLELRDPQTQVTSKYNLGYYLYRESKTDRYYGMVLDAIDRRVDASKLTLRLGFIDQDDLANVGLRIKESINFRLWEFVKSVFNCDPLTKNSINSIKKQSFSYLCSQQLQSQTIHHDKNKENIRGLGNKKVSNQPVSHMDKQQQCPQKKTELMLNQLFDMRGWQISQSHKINQSTFYSIFKNRQNMLLKLIFHSKQQLNCFEKYLEGDNANICEIQRHDDKNLMILQKFSSLCHHRHFIYKRKVDKIDKGTQSLAIIEQTSIKDNNTFSEITRKKKSILGYIQMKGVFIEEKSCELYKQKIIIELVMDHDDCLNQQLNQAMTQNYLRGIVTRFTDANNDDSYHSEGKVASFNTMPQSKPIFVDKDKLKTQQKNAPLLNPKNYLNNHYRQQPNEKICNELEIAQIPYHRILGPQWKRDEKVGGIVYLNQQQIDQQKGVLKFIFSSMGRNLLSGKSIFDISLPVHVFSTESNIERLIHSMRLINYFIEPQVNSCPFSLLLSSGFFSISTSLLYLSQQKPFNPILGETSQMWIDNCPCYGEQISHHPPISSIYYVGRGFKMFGSLESKVQLHMNSGTGSNKGALTIEFENGSKIINLLPPSEVSGLCYGQRKFKLTGKSHHIFISPKEIVFMEMKYGQHKCSLFSRSLVEDSFSNQFYRMTDNISEGQRIEELNYYLKNNKFKNSNNTTRLDSAEMNSWLISGISSEYAKNRVGDVLVEFSKLTPLQMSHEVKPLPSDSVWRSDIFQKKVGRNEAAQKYKEELEEKQRRDRSLRDSLKVK